MTPCPRCGAQHGLLRVEHRSRSDGTTYDRFFCASCGYRLEVSGRPNATQPA
jgi:transposase-like protein